MGLGLQQRASLRAGFDVGATAADSQFAFRRNAATCHGFTLVELLVVVAIIGVLAALVLPAVQAAREAARRAHCQNNLRLLGVALYVYHDAHKQLPVGCIEKRIPKTTPNGRQLSWSAELLPQLEEQSLWQQIDFHSPYDSPANANAAATAVAVYLCPSTARLAAGRNASFVSEPATTNGAAGYRGAAIDYGGIFGAAHTSPSDNGVFLYDHDIKLSDITDGTSHTLAIAEDSGRGWPPTGNMNGEWINGENIYDVGYRPNTVQDNEIWSDHSGGAMVLWCDGRTTLLSDAVEFASLRAFCTRAGDEAAGDTK
jgi:prepilin-type N-terminal cleavage/methylation domain-containing protein/prepilin-type processing-associated H-X9-DG protein